MRLIGLTVLCSLALGLLVAFAIRSRVPRLRWTASLAVLTSLGIGVAMVVLIPPRGEISDPQYYAHGPDIPRALEAVEAARRTSGVLDQELDAQLVGLARLVVDPGRRQLARRPARDHRGQRPAQQRGRRRPARAGWPTAARSSSSGDLTDRGSPFETRLVQRAAKTGDPFVFVSGNHDSDFSSRELAREGAIVLTRNGRLDKEGEPTGPIINKVKDLRVAGYDDPYERRMDESYADRYNPVPDPVEQEKFLGWLQPLLGKVDVVMVHEPMLIETALEVLQRRSARRARWSSSSGTRTSPTCSSCRA